RRNLTVRVSRDEGRTWPVSKLVRSGDSQYSCLARLPNGEIGLLHESWIAGNYRLFFVRFPHAWLAAPAGQAIGGLPAPEAVQAAAADERFVYAIANSVVAKYDRASGERVAASTGEAKHLN